MKTLFLNFLLLTFCFGQLSYGQKHFPNNNTGQAIKNSYPVKKLLHPKLRTDIGEARNSMGNLDPDWSERCIIGSDNNFATVKFGGLTRDNQGNYLYVALNGNNSGDDHGNFKGLMVKTQNNGTEIWRKEITNGFFITASKVATDNQDNIYVLGETMRDSINREIYLRKYTSDGIEVWTKYYSNENFVLPKGVSLFVDTDQNIIAVSVNTVDTEGIDVFYSIQKFDQAGSIIWQKTYAKESSYIDSFNFLEMSDNSFVLVDMSSCLKIDSDGEEQWNYTLNSGQYLLSAAKSIDDKIAIFSYEDFASQMVANVTLINSNGNEVWSQMVTSGYFLFSGTMCVDENGAITTIIRTYEDGPRIIKLNSNGEILFNNNCITGNSDFDAGGYYYLIHANEAGNYIVGGMSNNFTLLTATFDENGNSLIVNSLNNFQPGNEYIYAYDGYYFYDDKMILGANQREYNYIEENGYDLFVTAIDDSALPVWMQFTEKENMPRTIMGGNVLDDQNNTYLAANNAETFTAIKLDNAGDVIWSKRFFEDLKGGATEIAIMPDHSIVACGYAISEWKLPAVVHFDASGNSDWEYIMEEAGYGQANCVASDGDGNIIVAADGYSQSGNSLVFIFKFSPDGNLQWSYSNTNITSSKVRHLLIDNQNNIVFSGYQGYINNGAVVYAEKLTTNGGQIWQFTKTYTNSSLLYGALGDDNNNTYLVGQSEDNGIIVKINPSGELEWDNLSPYTGYYFGIAANRENGNIYVTGSKYTTETSEAKLTAYDTNGSELWTQNFGDPDKATFGFFILSDENNLYYSGYSVDGFFNQYSLLGVFDYDGNLIYDSEYKISRETSDNFSVVDFSQNTNYLSMVIQTSILEPSFANEKNVSYFGNIFRYPKNDSIVTGIEVVNHSVEKMRCYPNPVKDMLTITSDEDIQTVDIYSTLGVLVGNYEFNAGKRFRLNIVNLIPGLYIVHAKTEEGTEVFKFIRDFHKLKYL